MSFKDVKELRLAGKLAQALDLAKADLGNNLENIWNKRSIAWVYVDFLKKSASGENETETEEDKRQMLRSFIVGKRKPILYNYQVFSANLKNIQALNLPADEKMIFDSCAFQIGKVVFQIASEDTIDYSKIDELLETVKTFHITKPSEAYSFLFKAFHKAYKNSDYYISFADWWNFENFTKKDYEPEKFNDKTMLSMAEQAYIAYAKQLLEGEPMEGKGGFLHKQKNKAKIEAFLPKLEKLIAEQPNYTYPQYYKAKMLLALGAEDGVLAAFIPFAKHKQNVFWVWELLADVFDKSDERKFACLCKALSCKAPNDFLVKTRQKLAELLINKQMYSEAVTEIALIIDAREENNWQIPQQIEEWIKLPWVETTEYFENNNELYRKYLHLADEILHSDIPEETVAVEFVNTDKKILNFISSVSKFGFFNYSDYSIKPKIGDLLKVRFGSSNNEGFFKALTIKPAQETDTCEALQTFSGKISIKPDSNFGFVNDIFIEPKLLSAVSVANNQQISGKYIPSFNKKKNSWGKKAVSVQIVTD